MNNLNLSTPRRAQRPGVAEDEIDRILSQSAAAVADLDTEELRSAIRSEYEVVALNPETGFHFHTGRPLAERLGYEEEWLDRVPPSALASFAGTGNPFAAGIIHEGAHVVDVACGAGLDSLIAAHMVGGSGRVVGVDMTEAMLDRASEAAEVAGVANVDFRLGLAEELPVSDGWADTVISNGALNLVPNKLDALSEMARVLRPGGMLQIGDIAVERPVPSDAKADIDLWTG
jgi:SAM-dependent methyltransferase